MTTFKNYADAKNKVNSLKVADNVTYKEFWAEFNEVLKDCKEYQKAKGIADEMFKDLYLGHAESYFAPEPQIIPLTARELLKLEGNSKLQKARKESAKKVAKKDVEIETGFSHAQLAQIAEMFKALK
jgi:hypothetical protein